MKELPDKNLLGIQRVIGEITLPQQAKQLNNDCSFIYSDEILIDVEYLNLDAASYCHLKTSCDGNPERMKREIFKWIEQRGKIQNPVTGSGGMLVGTICAKGNNASHSCEIGDQIFSLVSLTLTPLQLSDIDIKSITSPQIKVCGKAILFENSIYTKIPENTPLDQLLALFDVCGAPALMLRYLQSDSTVMILGAGGRSGLLSAAAIRDSVFPNIQLIGIDSDASALNRMARSKWFDEIFNVDLRDVSAAIRSDLCNRADLVINCSSTPGTESFSILATKDGGTLLFFGMATSFSAAALGAEGIGKFIQMLIGSGYVPGHATDAVNLFRKSQMLQNLWEIMK